MKLEKYEEELCLVQKAQWREQQKVLNCTYDEKENRSTKAVGLLIMNVTGSLNIL